MTASLVLSIDTASTRGVVVLARGDTVLAASTYLAGSDHAEKLLDHVRAVLTRAETTLERVERFGVGLGPGSFTGVRVGVATIKGLALAFPRPVATVSTLAVLVEASSEHVATIDASHVGALLSAGRDDVFVGMFAPSDTTQRALSSPRVEVVPHGALGAFFVAHALESVVGADAARLLPGVFDRTVDEGLPTPSALARLCARASLIEGAAVTDLEPAYARPPQITTSRPRFPSV